MATHKEHAGVFVANTLGRFDSSQRTACGIQTNKKAAQTAAVACQSAFTGRFYHVPTHACNNNAMTYRTNVTVLFIYNNRHVYLYGIKTRPRA